MLIISGLGKSYGERTLFEAAALQLQRGERVGLIGANGAGKSTLFSLVLGSIEADAGSVELERGVRVGYLQQESTPVTDETVLHLAAAISPEMEGIYAQLRAHPDPESEEHQVATARWAELDGFRHEARAKRILGGLAFRESDIERPARTLSGGWVMRAHLARLLVQEPDLLMLDEPTNHLDLESLGWFQNYLKQYPGTLLIISHDRAFLNALCTGVVEIAYRRLHRYTGNYDRFLEQKAARQEQQKAAYENQQKEIAHIQSFIDRFRYKASKAAQVQSRIKQLEKLERIEAPESEAARVSFRFPQPPRSGHKVMELKAVRQAYGAHEVYRSLDLILERGERIALVGPNGAGKSTLLKILGNIVPIQGGERLPGLNAKVGYFSQQRSEVLQLKRSVIEEAMDNARNVHEQEVRNLLGSFLFRGDDIYKAVEVLSGGEKSRLALVKLLLDPPNLLLLDEPTTHLDIPSIDALITALEGYTGTLLFVSHDVYFIRKIAQSVLHIDAGKLTRYAGGYDYYLEKSEAVSERAGLVAAGLSNHRPEEAKSSGGSAQPSMSAKDRRREAAAQREAERALKKEVERLESRVIELEEQQAELTTELEDPELYADPKRAKSVRRQLDAIVAELKQVNTAWEAAAENLS
ncbi:MAG: ABC-F family ATP-binding cassette domain-containing protein [Opitutales bacterium]|nr:ABC-F family ATP-binding cassette domain-containing protein [Opitutales bacterium]